MEINMTQSFVEGDFLDYLAVYTIQDKPDNIKYNSLIELSEDSEAEKYENKMDYYCNLRRLGLSRDWARWRKTQKRKIVN